MMTCIACSKQLADAGDEEPPAAAARGSTPRTKEVVRSLTSQIKDMVLKFSGAHRKNKLCNGGTSSSPTAAYRRSGSVGSHVGMDGVWEPVEGRDRQYKYVRAGGSSGSGSITGWDFTCAGAEAPAVSTFANSGRRWIQGLRPQGAERSTAEGVPYGMAVAENGERKEWVAQVEPGVHITFFSVAGGGNDLKRIRFREMFNKGQAQRWWGENYDRIMELYNVQRFSRQALPTPPRSDDEVKISGSTEQSPAAPPMGEGRTPAASRVGGSHDWAGMFHPVPDPTEHVLQQYQNHPVAAAAAAPGTCWRPGEAASSVDASMTATTPSRDEASASVSNASDQEAAEWVEQDEPGVYITIRQLPDGTRELRRVRFSREHFAERHAKQWWELNRERIQAQYL